MVHQHPVGGRRWGEGGHGGWGITYSEVHSQEKGGVVVGAPNTCLAGDVKDVQGGVIGHKGTCVMRRPGPATQRGQEEVSRAAEDLGEDSLPEGPIGGQWPFQGPQEGTRRLWGKVGNKEGMQPTAIPGGKVGKCQSLHV